MVSRRMNRPVRPWHGLAVEMLTDALPSDSVDPRKELEVYLEKTGSWKVAVPGATSTGRETSRLVSTGGTTGDLQSTEEKTGDLLSTMYDASKIYVEEMPHVTVQYNALRPGVSYDDYLERISKLVGTGLEAQLVVAPDIQTFPFNSGTITVMKREVLCPHLHEWIRNEIENQDGCLILESNIDRRTAPLHITICKYDSENNIVLSPSSSSSSSSSVNR
jgi:hypothetical protein